MGLLQSIVFMCDRCDKHFTIGNDMELPPGWLGVQLAIADSNGYIPTREREVYMHFCSLECLSEFIDSDELKERFYLVDKQEDSEEE